MYWLRVKKEVGYSITQPRSLDPTHKIKNYKMSRARNWCFTINNYDEDSLLLLREAAKLPCSRYLVYQQERGAEGTPHIQGFISLKTQQRLGQLKKLVGDRAHLEVAKGTPEQNRIYCTKEQTREAGTLEEFGSLPDKAGKRNDLENVITTIKDGVFDLKRLRDEHPEVCAKYPRFIRELIGDHQPLPEIEEHVLHVWQKDLKELLDKPPNDREIIFVVDENGNQGKTWFAKHYCKTHVDAQYMEPGKKADMAFALETTKRVLFVNVTRQQVEHLQYSFYESVKDGLVFSPKYESGMKYLEKMHVVILMNQPPDMTLLSKDRYKIINLY